MQEVPSGNGGARATPHHALTELKGVLWGGVLPSGPRKSNAGLVQPCAQAETLFLRMLDITGTLYFPHLTLAFARHTLQPGPDAPWGPHHRPG